MSWLCVQKESAYCNCKQFGREMKKKEEEGSASVRLGIYGSCWRDAAVWVHQECVLCKNCSHAEVCSLTTANKLPREHWLRFFFFLIVILNLLIIWESLLLLCAPDASAGQKLSFQDVFPKLFQVFPIDDTTPTRQAATDRSFSYLHWSQLVVINT